MSYRLYQDFLADHGLSRTGTIGGEVALKKTDTLSALGLLFETGIGVLGGDVYEREIDGYFRPTHDNWYCNKASCDPSTFVVKSHTAARDYIMGYREADGSDIWYVLVPDA